MGMFKNILVRAHHGDKEAVDKLYEQYKPLLRKYSFVNGVFDEDLHHKSLLISPYRLHPFFFR